MNKILLSEQQYAVLPF